jgi:hypothetical protein
MAFTAEEQKIYDFAKSAIPRFMFQKVRQEEEFGALVKMFDAARQQIAAYFLQAYILTADGSGPDFLNQHAIGRNTFRQDGETDAALRQRLRNIEDALTRPALLAAADAILLAELGAGFTAAMAELRRDRGFFGTYVSDTGTGGEFTGTAPDMAFEPDAPGFDAVPEVNFARSGAQGNPQFVFSGALSGGNNGTFPVDDVTDDTYEYQNGSGVAEVDAGVSWTLEKRDVDGNVRDGFARAYFSRGYRMSNRALSIILPYGCSASTQEAIREMLRQKKGAGLLGRSECMDGLNWPTTAADLSGAMLDGDTSSALPDSIWLHGVQSSGVVLDFLGAADLTVIGSPTRKVISQEWGYDVLAFRDGTTDAAQGANSTVHDVTTGSFAVLGTFRTTTAPSVSSGLVGKASAGSGWAIALDNVADGRIDFVANGTGGFNLGSVGPFTPHSFHDPDKRHFYLLVRNTTSGFWNLYTTLGNMTAVAESAGDLTNAGLFAYGDQDAGSASVESEVPYGAFWTGAAAEALDVVVAANPTALHNLHTFLGLGGLIP